MPFFKYLLSIVFVLFASTALAAKPGKTLVCHVGNELGSSGETYQDNPDCIIPAEWVGDPADYKCPDAGKIDLILVPPNAKHIGNPDHSFLDAENYLWEDYAPEDGVGNDPADFEEGDVVGIDRGCELPEPNLTCPCWDSYTASSLAALVDDQPGGCSTYFSENTDYASGSIRKQDYPSGTYIWLEADSDLPENDGRCNLETHQLRDTQGLRREEIARHCYRELQVVASQTTGCP